MIVGQNKSTNHINNINFIHVVTKPTPPHQQELQLQQTTNWKAKHNGPNEDGIRVPISFAFEL